MYGINLLLLLLLNLLSKVINATHQKILIEIRASESGEITTTATGQSKTTIISSAHKELFHLTDQLLKNAVFKISGQQTEVFIDDDGSGIFENYNAQPVGTLLKPNGTSLKVIEEEVILNKLQAFNDDAIAKTQIIKLTGNIEDNMTCLYKQKDVFPAEITHYVDVISLGKSPNWNMKSIFGKDLSETRLVSIANASFTMKLGPKQDATAILSATKVTAIIQVNYIAMLTGNILAKYENSYVWGYENYDIATVMEAAGMPHSVLLREEITIGFYKDCFIKVYGEVYATNDVNQCTFNTIDGNQEIPNLKWKADRRELGPISLPSLKAGIPSNGARTSVAIILLIICALIKIL